MILLDTSICIEHTRENPVISARIYRLGPKDVGISALTHFELERGISESDPQFKRINRELLDRFLKNVRVFDFTHREAAHAARLFGRWKRQGCAPSDLDGLIAAHANYLKAKLVYCDADFQRLKLPRAECWPKA